MSDEKFPLPGSSYKELSKIIAAYASISGSTAPAAVGQIAVVHETVVSRNNKFLVAVGLIEGGQKKACTTLGISLGRAIQHEQEDAIREGWSKVVAQTDFFQKIISAVRIRKGMEESALASHIAFTSGSGKNAPARAGAGAVIEILRMSGSINAEGSTLVASSSVMPSANDQSSNSDLVWSPVHTNQEYGATLLRRESQSDGPRRAEETGTKLTISLSITCGVADLDGLGLKLKKLKKEFEGDEEIDISLNVPVISDSNDNGTTDAPSSTETSGDEEPQDEVDR